MNSLSSQELENRRTKELQILGALMKELKDAKQELSNDLTRLAMKNLPLMVQNEENVITTGDNMGNIDDQTLVATTSQPVTVSLSQSTEESTNSNQQELQELEPLDLDIWA